MSCLGSEAANHLKRMLGCDFILETDSFTLIFILFLKKINKKIRKSYFASLINLSKDLAGKYPNGSGVGMEILRPNNP